MLGIREAGGVEGGTEQSDGRGVYSRLLYFRRSDSSLASYHLEAYARLSYVLGTHTLRSRRKRTRSRLPRLPKQHSRGVHDPGLSSYLVCVSCYAARVSQVFDLPLICEDSVSPPRFGRLSPCIIQPRAGNSQIHLSPLCPLFTTKAVRPRQGTTQQYRPSLYGKPSCPPTRPAVRLSHLTTYSGNLLNVAPNRHSWRADSE